MITNKITPQSILQQIAQIPHMERGKLCILRAGPDGPYFNHQTWENGKNVSRYIPQDQVPAMKQALAGYEQFESLTDQYAQMIIQKTRAELTTGFKKKTSPPNSSWPKTKRSSS
jgi:hypothetical protein